MTLAKKLRILIVDDSSLARALLRSLIEDQDDMQIVGEAHNGHEAVRLCADLKPDLVTMDLMMPVMDGMAAIEAIMHERAVPILVISSQADAQRACQALDLGALEVIGKPDFTSDEPQELLRKIRLLAGVSVFTRFRRSNRMLQASIELTPLPKSTQVPQPDFERVVAIASSTGGPQALARILPRLPADFPAPILVAQHMSDGFVDGMARWLDGLCQLEVRVAKEGELIRPGCIYISPSECHLEVNAAHRVRLQARQEKDIYRPSCDHLLASVAKVYRHAGIGLILTGMGRDGAQGMLALHQAGGVTLAQDEASSVIFGMNQVAIETGGVHLVLPLDQLPANLTRAVSLSPTAYLTLAREKQA